MFSSWNIYRMASLINIVSKVVQWTNSIYVVMTTFESDLNTQADA